MKVDRRLVICAIASVVGHLAFARGLDYLPRREDKLPPQIVQVKVIEPAPPELLVGLPQHRIVIRSQF